MRNYLFLFLLPFVLSLGFYHWKITYPFFQGNPDYSKWTIYLQPTFITIGLITLGSLLGLLIIRSSILRGGYFLKRKKKEMLASYLKSNDITFRTKKKTDNGVKDVLKFPKVYYRPTKEYDEFTFEIGNKFQDRFMQIGKELENMYLADLIHISREMGFITYRFLIDNIQARLNFEDLKAETDRIELMKGATWVYRDMPHMLITGGTGGGKTYFIYSLIATLGKIGRVHIADPKKSDLSHLESFSAFKGLVVSETADIFTMLEEAVELMDKRYLMMIQHENFRIGKDYTYYDMKPEFFIIDEFAALMSTLETRGDYTEIKLMQLLTPLVLKARQAGIFVIIATQRAGTDVLKSSIRDNLSCKVSLGRLSPMGYDMTFGEDNKNKMFVNKEGVKGRGYIDIGAGVPLEFYAPFVSKDLDFMTYFKDFPEIPFTDVSQIEYSNQSKEEIEEVVNQEFIQKEQDLKVKRKNEIRKEMALEKEKTREQISSNAGLSFRDQMIQNANIIS
ncbi:MAG: cell division protein FtsK [Streptococcaceae bacterium]|nr:cell division protein FtsK [Streptococcaceae bacterium]